MNKELLERITNIIKEGMKETKKIYSGKLIIDFVDVFLKNEEEYKTLTQSLEL